VKAIGSAGRVRSVLIAKGAVGFVRGGAGVCLTGGLVAYVNVRRELRNALRTLSSFRRALGLQGSSV